jgi:hypothetical protein
MVRAPLTVAKRKGVVFPPVLSLPGTWLPRGDWMPISDVLVGVSDGQSCDLGVSEFLGESGDSQSPKCNIAGTTLRGELTEVALGKGTLLEGCLSDWRRPRGLPAWFLVVAASGLREKNRGADSSVELEH